MSIHTSRISDQFSKSEQVQKAFAPLIAWALLGAAFLAVMIYAFLCWIFGPHFKPVPAGPDIPPGWMIITARCIETTTIVDFLTVLYVYVIKPWRRNGEISGDGLMVLALITMYWQNALPNYFAITVLMPSMFINFGSWYGYLPGWVSPNWHLIPEAVVAWGLCYACWFVFFPMKMGAKGMGLVKRKYPGLNATGLFLFFWMIFLFLDVVLEGAFVRTGMYAWAGTPHNLAFWGGERYQLPYAEALGWSLCWTIWASMYYYRDDHGLTFVERGIDTFRVKRPVKKFIRFLALVGIFNICFLVILNIPVGINGLNTDPWPEGYKSYLTNGICGPNTAYDCPHPNVPFPTQTTTTNRICPSANGSK
jgi:hypothetical protein